MAKYRIVREQLQAEAAAGKLTARFEPSPLASEDDLLTCHSPGYVLRYLRNEFTAMENRRVGFPWSEASVRRSLSPGQKLKASDPSGMSTAVGAAPVRARP